MFVVPSTAQTIEERLEFISIPNPVGNLKLAVSRGASVPSRMARVTRLVSGWQVGEYEDSQGEMGVAWGLVPTPAESSAPVGTRWEVVLRIRSPRPEPLSVTLEFDWSSQSAWTFAEVGSGQHEHTWSYRTCTHHLVIAIPDDEWVSDVCRGATCDMHYGGVISFATRLDLTRAASLDYRIRIASAELARMEGHLQHGESRQGPAWELVNWPCHLKSSGLA